MPRKQDDVAEILRVLTTEIVHQSEILKRLCVEVSKLSAEVRGRGFRPIGKTPKLYEVPHAETDGRTKTNVSDS